WYLQFDFAGNCVGGEEHWFVAKPCRLGNYRLVAGVEYETESHHNRRKCAGRECNIGRFERQRQFAPESFGEKSLRRFLARLVGKPVLVFWHGSLTQRRDKSVQRHFVGIAKREVADARIAAALAISRGEIKILYGCECRIGRPNPRRNDRHPC